MKRRLSLLLFLAILLTACAAAPSGTATARPTETPTSEPSPVPTKVVSVSEIFKASPDFYKALSAQDKNAAKDFTVENGKTYLLIGTQKFEVDPSSAAVNLDVNGNPLLVENTGYINPITIRGVGKEANQVFAYAPQTKINLEEGKEKVFPAHWFEVIQTNHPVDQKASFEEQMKQREIAINDPIKVTVDQVQSGEWAMSVLLSGMVNLFPADWKFTGNALNNTGGSIVLYTSDKIPIDFFGIVKVDGKSFGVRPFQIWNPTDQQNPDRNQISIINIGMGEENLTKEQNLSYLDFVYNTGVYPNLMIQFPDSDKRPTLGSGPLIDHPSVLSLKQLPGNDPANIQFIGGTINVDIPKSGVDPDLWQWGYTDPLPQELQNLIWLAYF